jgi:hypothetical protein
MTTTISELSRNCVSLPGANGSIVPPSAPPRPARAEPRKKTTANTSWMFRPRAEAIARSSTPARIAIPSRVRWIISQSANASTTAAPSTASRKSG